MQRKMAIHLLRKYVPLENINMKKKQWVLPIWKPMTCNPWDCDTSMVPIKIMGDRQMVFNENHEDPKFPWETLGIPMMSQPHGIHNIRIPYGQNLMDFPWMLYLL